MPGDILSATVNLYVTVTQRIVLFLLLIQNVLFLMGMINAEPDPIPALCVQCVIYSELKLKFEMLTCREVISMFPVSFKSWQRNCFFL